MPAELYKKISTTITELYGAYYVSFEKWDMNGWTHSSSWRLWLTRTAPLIISASTPLSEICLLLRLQSGKWHTHTKKNNNRKVVQEITINMYILIYTFSCWSKWGALIRTKIMGQECMQPSMQVYSIILINVECLQVEMVALTLASEDLGSLAKLQTLHTHLQLSSYSHWGYEYQRINKDLIIINCFLVIWHTHSFTNKEL